MIKILNTAGFILLLYIWIFTAVSFFSLPKTIPLHFDLDGHADSFGSRFWIFGISVIATILFYFMKYVAKQKDSSLLNMPEEMKQNRKITNLFVKIILIYVMLLFADLATETVLIARGKYDTLSSVPTVLIGLMMFSIVGFFIYAKRKIHIID